jgi:hypothetical protein
MPHFRNNTLVVEIDELVPSIFSYEGLMKKIQRYKNKDYGIKRFQRACLNNQLLIEYDSLDINIQNTLGDPRKVNHILERFYKTDGEAVKYFATYSFDDGTYLDQPYQERYIINASVLKAIIGLKSARMSERKAKGGNMTGLSKSLWKDAISFQDTLQIKFNEQHTLPSNERRFNDALKDFEKLGYKTLISAKHKNTNSKKVTDQTLDLLKSLFADENKKPTATQVHRIYKSFIAGYMEVINHNTGELFNPKDFKSLSDATVKKYMATWENAISTLQKRSGNRQEFMGKFKPYHSFDKPKFAGSIISIDDRQPPFKMPDGQRVWFYNGIDLASEAFICWVHGRSKEGIIVEFYRQLVRNFTAWGLNMPAELEAEMSLNSSFTGTFLRPGAMFEHVKIEANNARGKRIERYFGNLRYDIEREREGWLARPKALKESNQAGPHQEKALPYNTIVHGCLQDIENWNNQPHSIHTHLTRWEVFTQMQNPDLKQTNWASFMPYLGRETKTSVNTGIIKLQNELFLLGSESKIATGDKLINLMRQVEGNQVNIYWLDDNNGQVLKALVYLGTRYVCEALAKPKPQRARVEQTAADLEAFALMSAYVATIEGYGRTERKAIDKVTIINTTPTKTKSFLMPGLNPTPAPAPKEELIQPGDEYVIAWPAQTRSLKDTF